MSACFANIIPDVREIREPLGWGYLWLGILLVLSEAAARSNVGSAWLHR